jgi:hypothetical protein
LFGRTTKARRRRTGGKERRHDIDARYLRGCGIRLRTWANADVVRTRRIGYNTPRHAAVNTGLMARLRILRWRQLARTA